MHANVARSLCPHNPPRLEVSTHHVSLYPTVIGFMYTIDHANAIYTFMNHTYNPLQGHLPLGPSLTFLFYLFFSFSFLILNT